MGQYAKIKAEMIRRTTILLVWAVIISSTVWAATSQVTTFPTKEVWGQGPLPYNYRIIDGHIHAGGHPLNPATSFDNSDKEVLKILDYLKSQGVKTVIDLEKTGRIQDRYRRLLEEAKLKRIHIPMHAFKVPNPEEWETIKTAMEGPVYIHCKWGADRTGAIIARYLVEEKGYTSREAFNAVITGGSHAGPIGGLKTTWFYRNLIRFFWKDYWGW